MTDISNGRPGDDDVDDSRQGAATPPEPEAEQAQEAVQVAFESGVEGG